METNMQIARRAFVTILKPAGVAFFGAILALSGGFMPFLATIAHAEGEHAIYTCAELEAIGDDPDTINDEFYLMNDIDCESTPFTPITWGDPFGGDFDGSGFTISNLAIDGDSGSAGLFANTNSADLKNVVLASGSVTTDASYAGGLVGEAVDTDISNVVSHLDVTSAYEAGGLAGDYRASGANISIEDSGATGTVTGEGGVGGLIGVVVSFNAKSIAIERSYTTGDVIGDDDSGGLIGYVEGISSALTGVITLEDVYSQSNVSASSGAHVGGLVGHVSNTTTGSGTVDVTIQRAYASGTVHGVDAVGGLIGKVDDITAVSSRFALENSFAAAIVDPIDPVYYGAVIGELGTGNVVSGEVYYDGHRATTNTCSGDNALNVCTDANPSGAEADYFTNNDENAPMVDWNFDSVWMIVEDGYPVFYHEQDEDDGDDSGDGDTEEGPDTDNDGISDDDESAAPNEGDANGDGTLDSEQANVTSFVSPVSGKYVALELPDACAIDSAQIKTEDTNTVADSGYNYPLGMLNFTVNCGTPGYTAPITQYYYDAGSANYVVRKFKPSTQAYLTVPGAAVSKVAIGGQEVTKATYQVVDGSTLDDDNTPNGIIVDPAGLGVNIVGVPNTGFGRQ